jgi:exodeoxyribonuclease V alpha subunit
MEELSHAFAITIHKSQGSEYEAVIIPVYGGVGRIFNRNLIYTAVTRAKSLVVMVGEDNERHSMMQIINGMIDNTEEQERYTGFAEKLIKFDV